MRLRGTVSSFSRKSNYIFITPEGMGHDAFCHRSDVESPEPLQTGMLVEFDLQSDGEERRAVNVTPLRPD